MFRSDEIAGYHDWEHLRQVILVRKIIVHKHGGPERIEDRYFITNLPSDRVSAKTLLEMVRRHWLIENGPHWTLDTQFKEDTCPLNGRAVLIVALLRAIAYNILGLLRVKHLRSKQNRARSWQSIMELVYDTILLSTSPPVKHLSYQMEERAAPAA